MGRDGATGKQDGRRTNTGQVEGRKEGKGMHKCAAEDAKSGKGRSKHVMLTMEELNASALNVVDPGATGERKRNKGPIRQSIVKLCSPNDFCKTVANLSEAKSDAVNDMGFGCFQRIGFPALIEPICQMMVDGIDIGHSTVSLHGTSFPLTPRRFAGVMGLNEGGANIQVPPTMNWYGKEWLREALCNNEGCIVILQLKDIVRHRPQVDDLFRIAYCMYALTTILCPGTTDAMKDTWLSPLMSTGEINNQDWGEFSLRFLLEGVRAYKADEVDIIPGCMIFLQLLYFDIVGEGCIYVDRSLPPLAAWGVDEVKELQETVSILGGYNSTNVPLKRTKRLDRDASSGETGKRLTSDVDRALREELYGVKLKLSGVEREMYSVTTIVGQMRPELSGLKTTVERLVKCVADFQGECAAIMMESLVKNGRLPQTVISPDVKVNMKGIANPSPCRNDVNYREYEVPTLSPDKCGLVLKFNKVGDGKSYAHSNKGYSPVSASSSSPGEPLNTHIRPHVKERISDTMQVKPHHARALFNHASKQTTEPMSDMPYMELNSMIGMRGHVAGPYVLRRSLSEADVELINVVFLGGRNFTRTEGRTVVAANRDAVLYRDEIDCLGPHRYVTSCVINFVVEYLNVENSPFWYLPNLFGQNANSINPNMLYEDWVDRAATLCQIWRFSGRLEQCQRIFVPLHEEANGGHWFLMVVHPMTLVAEIWDSSPSIETYSSRLATARAALRHLDDVLYQDPFDEVGAPTTFFGDFRTIVPDNVPHQSNGCDCGIYVIQHMQYYGTNWWTEYDSNEQRVSLLLQCLKPPVNERYGHILASKVESELVEPITATGNQNMIAEGVKRGKNKADKGGGGGLWRY